MSTENANTNNDILLKYAFEFLENEDWEGAIEYCDKVLANDSENPEAYLGKLLAELECKTIEDLQFCDATDILVNPNRSKLYDCVAALDEDDDNDNDADKVDSATLVARQIGLAMFRENLEYFFEYETVQKEDGTKYILKSCNDGIISGTFLEGMPVIEICEDAFEFCSNLEDIIIPEGVTKIGNGVFSNCEKLNEVTIPSSVTSIGKQAFWECNSLESIEIPDEVTCIGDMAFGVCKNLTKIDLGNGVESIGEGAFKYCSSLESINIPASVTSIQTSWDVMSNIFYACDSLTSITVSSENPKYYGEGNCLIEKETKTIIAGCNSSVIPNDVTNVARGAFEGRNSLTSITIPGNVKSIEDYAFTGCTNLSNLTIANGVTSIGSQAFVRCKNLVNITIPDSVTNIDYFAFSQCDNLASITVSAENPVYYSEGNCLIEKETKTIIAGCKNSVIPNDVITIGLGAFDGCTGLVNITIPDSVTCIEGSAFTGCTNLKSITLPSSVTTIEDDAFDETTRIVRKTASNSNANNITNSKLAQTAYENATKAPLPKQDTPAEGIVGKLKSLWPFKK